MDLIGFCCCWCLLGFLVGFRVGYCGFDRLVVVPCLLVVFSGLGAVISGCFLCLLNVI